MRRKTAFLPALVPLSILTVLTAASLAGCSSPEDKAWESFSGVMDRSFGQGNWSADSHAFAEGTLTVSGVKASVPPAYAVYLKAKADATAKAQADYEAAAAQDRADAEAARKANEARRAREAGESDESGDAEGAGGSGATEGSGGRDSPWDPNVGPAPPAEGDPPASPPAAPAPPVSPPATPAPSSPPPPSTPSTESTALPYPPSAGDDGGPGRILLAQNDSGPEAGAPLAVVEDDQPPAPASPPAAASAPAPQAPAAEAAPAAPPSPPAAASAPAAPPSPPAAASAPAPQAPAPAGDSPGGGGAGGAEGDAIVEVAPPAVTAGTDDITLEGAESPAPDPAAQTPAAPENPNAPTAEKPGITIKTVKVTGLAPPELLLRLSRNSGSPLEVFSSLEIEELLVHSGKSAELGSVELLVPGATLTGLSCRPGGAPEGGTASPACTLAKIASGQGYGFGLVFTYPEPDYRLSLRMDVASYAVDALSVGGGDGTGTSGIKAADAIFNALEMSLSAAEGVLTVGVSVDTMHAQGLEGLYFAQATAIEGAGVFVDIGDDMLWQATADSFSAMGLDMREELSSEGARPGAHFVGQFYGEYGGGLLEALWPNWDSVLSQRYSAGSWRVDGFKASGGDGQRLEIRTAYASGPLTRGKLANSYLELSGVELEFPSDVWHDEYLVKTAEFLGTNVLKGDLRVWKAFDPENNTVRWAVNSLDVRDLGRAALDISVAGVKDATVEAFSGIRLRNIDRLLASVAAQDLGLGAIEISLSAQPVMDRLVIRTAEEKETIPSAALSEMASSVSMALLYVLTEHASVESTMAVTDAVVDFMKKPQIITVKTDPSSPLNAAAIAAWQQDPGSLVELLNLSVSSNEKLPVALEQ